MFSGSIRDIDRTNALELTLWSPTGRHTLATVCCGGIIICRTNWKINEMLQVTSRFVAHCTVRIYFIVPFPTIGRVTIGFIRYLVEFDLEFCDGSQTILAIDTYNKDNAHGKEC